MSPAARRTKRYTEEDFCTAYKAVKTGMSWLKAARMYNIPKTTLRDRVLSGQLEKRRQGSPTVLNEKEELRLEDWIWSCWCAGFTKCRESTIGAAGRRILKEGGRTTRHVEFGRHWLHNFGQRHPRVQEAIKNRWCTQRTNCKFGRAQLQVWFERVASYFSDRGLDQLLEQPQRLLHCTQVKFKHVSVIVSYSAAGLATPPLLVLPTNAERIKLTLPKGWARCTQAEAQVDEAVLLHYLQTVLRPFLLHVQLELPVLLFLDQQAETPNLDLFEECRKLNIVLINLYNMAFQKLRLAWKQPLEDWCTAHLTPSQSDYADFVDKLKDALVYNFTKPNMRNAFRSTGIFPFGMAHVDTSYLAQDSQTENGTKIVDANATVHTLDNGSDESLTDIQKIQLLDADVLLLDIPFECKLQTLDFTDFKALIGKTLYANLEEHDNLELSETKSAEFLALHKLYEHLKAAQEEDEKHLDALNINLFEV